jgi:hypothetical protein
MGGRVKLKSRVARASSRLQALLATPAIYLAPLMVGAAPLLVLYWLYQPTVLANPRLSAYKAPVATLLVPPIREPESLESVALPTNDALADVADDAAPPSLDQATPESGRSAKGPHPAAAGHNLHLRRSAAAPAPSHGVKTAVNDHGRRAGVAMRSAAAAYAYAPDQLRW